MIHSLLRASACLLFLLAGCDVGPTDEPLPTVADLRDEFERPEPGRGVIVDGRTRYETDAVYYAQDSTSRIAVDLVSDEPGTALSVLIEGRQRPGLREGAELTVRFLYSGTSDGSRGGGVLGITLVDGDRIAGVFAADLTPNGLVPQFPRIRGAFHATRRAE